MSLRSTNHRFHVLVASLAMVVLCNIGCHSGPDKGPGYDRPFPLGAVTDAHWETQQTNAEAADFIFFDHEFRGDTARLAPGAKKHLEQVALRLEHVPFAIVIEESQHDADPGLDEQRRQTIIHSLARMGIVDVEDRVVVANAFAEGITGMEGESTYYRSLMNGNGQGFGRRFGGTGSFYR